MTTDKGQSSMETNGRATTAFDELRPGDRIEVENGIVFDIFDTGSEMTKTRGTVLRTEHGSHPDKSGCECGDLILMELPDGDLLVVTVSESTIVRRA
jgi:hypothetical protein